jgi:hypothetical protein
MEAIRYWNLFYCFVIFQEMFDKAKCPIRDKNRKKRQKNVCTGFRNVRTFVLDSTASKSCPEKKKCYAVHSAEQLFEKVFSKTRNRKCLLKILMQVQFSLSVWKTKLFCVMAAPFFSI